MITLGHYHTRQQIVYSNHTVDGKFLYYKSFGERKENFSESRPYFKSIILISVYYSLQGESLWWREELTTYAGGIRLELVVMWTTGLHAGGPYVTVAQVAGWEEAEPVTEDWGGLIREIVHRSEMWYLEDMRLEWIHGYCFCQVIYPSVNKLYQAIFWTGLAWQRE